MSTNEAAVEFWAPTLKAMEGVPAGLPDPAVLARMANEFFAADGSTQSVTDAAPAPVAVPPVAAAPAPASPSLPGTPSAAVVPGFSFLQEIRPLFPEIDPQPAAANPFALPLGDLNLKELKELDGAAPPAPALETLQPPMPTVPGALGAFDSSAFPTFSFLQEARPLYSYPPAVPGPMPAQQTDASLSNSNSPSGAFDASVLRRDFPILRERVNGRPLVWLDNAATTQKPQSVIDRLSYFYAHENSNVHRAAHELAARATDAYESAREKVRRFLNASAPREIIFVRGATEGINLVAQSWGRHNILQGDEIVITWLEHHANIVPWQMLCAEKGARLRVAPVDDTGQVILEEYEKLLNPKTRLVSAAQVSNALGTVTPLTEMIESAHRHGAKFLVDGAQAVSHMRADVQALNCDFYVLSGHKMFAPTGIGAVYGKSEILDVTPPWQGGGSMIQDVTFEKTVYSPPPAKFEAGTGNIADAVGLGAAIDYLDRVGMANIARYEAELLTYATSQVQRIPGLHIIGTAKEKAGVLSFVLDGVPTEEMGNLLNREGIAVRSGHHCAQPILRRFGLERTVRASLALYNTCEDIDALVSALLRIQAGFRS
jgi:cysteine desulfurase/selenocysteine lyase